MIALGSNQRHPRYGAPAAIIAAATAVLARLGWSVEAVSPIRASRPLGPSWRTYANAAAVISGAFEPEAALADLQAVEAAFGRERRGQRWRARVLDIDIVLWSGGAWAQRHLTIPHPQFRSRDFVLAPAAAVAPHWRDPVTRLTMRQLAARHRRSAPKPS